MENIEEKLKVLGIEDKEAIIYMAILKLKKTTITRLSRFTGIKRTTVYHCIEGLMNRGLVVKNESDNQKLYLAEDPEKSISSILEEKNQLVRSIIPDLKNIFGFEAIQPEIKIYHNVSGIKKIFEDILLSKEKFGRYYVSNFDVDNLLGEEFLAEFVRKRIKLGIGGKSIRSFEYKPQREEGITHTKQLREVKFFPEGMNLKSYICIYDHRVVVISAKEKIGFIVESESFSQTQKAIFDMVWNTIAI
jgi:sugar-specific transcriptional regulator TrmB